MTDPFAICARVVRDSGSSFALSFRFLPPSQRRAMNAIYAFCRRTDDIADEPGAVEAKRQALADWRAEITDRGRDPIIQAVVSTCAEFDINPQHLHAVIDGCEMDLNQSRFATMADLEIYCSRVAGAVGHLCMGVWGVRGETAERFAESQGLAVQLTNILRDVREDAGENRIYIPQEILKKHGVGEENILGLRMTEGVLAAMRELASISHRSYIQADARVFGRSERRRIWPAIMMARTYRTILRKIEREGFPVLERRVRLSCPHKLWILTGVMLRRLFP